MQNRSPLINVILYSLFWALQIFFAKLGLMDGAKPLPFQIQSSFIALVILSVFLWRKISEELREMYFEHRSLFRKLIYANAIHYGVGGCFVLIGIAFTTAINAGFLVKFSIVTTTIMAWILLGERMTTTKKLLIFTMLLGVYLLTTKGKAITPNSGDFIIICACFAWSLGNVLIRQALRDHTVSADLVTFLKPVAGIPLMLLFFFSSWLHPLLTDFMKPVIGRGLCEFGSFSIYTFATGVFYALLWIYLNRTLKVASASYMTMMSVLTSVFVAILAMIFLNERMELIQVLGAVLIIASGVWVYRSDIHAS